MSERNKEQRQNKKPEIKNDTEEFKGSKETPKHILTAFIKNELVAGYNIKGPKTPPPIAANSTYYILLSHRH